MNYNPFSLQGKTIFVTGASSGIGVGIAETCSRMGAAIVITGRNKERLQQTFQKLDVSDKEHHQIVANLMHDSDIEMIAQNLPQLDGIVLNAGMIKTVTAKYISSENIAEVFQTNIISSIQLIQKLLRLKKIKKGASIVFISSIATSRARIGNSLYSATKGGVNSFMKVLALELAPQKITVNCIQPGFIKSNMLIDGAISQEQIEEFSKIYPMGIGEPADIANACIYLLSDAAKWVTGSILTVDGGGTLK